MGTSHEERVRQRAFEIWQHEGCPSGLAEEHWHRAEEEIALDDADQAGGPGLAEGSTAYRPGGPEVERDPLPDLAPEIDRAPRQLPVDAPGETAKAGKGRGRQLAGV